MLLFVRSLLRIAVELSELNRLFFSSCQLSKECEVYSYRSSINCFVVSMILSLAGNIFILISLSFEIILV